jgi:hypothetical protein
VRGTVAEQTRRIFGAMGDRMDRPVAKGDVMKRRVATIVLILAGIAASAAGPVGAAEGPTTTIAVHVEFAGSTSWSSVGAFADEGSIVPLSQRFGSPFGPSRQWTAHEEILFVGQAGSFSISQQALLVYASPAFTTGTSHWIVRSGTGTYAALRGHGTATVVIHWDVGTLDVAITGTFDLNNELS